MDGGAEGEAEVAAVGLHVSLDAVVVRVAAGEQPHPGRAAERVGDVVAVERHAALGEQLAACSASPAGAVRRSRRRARRASGRRSGSRRSSGAGPPLRRRRSARPRVQARSGRAGPAAGQRPGESAFDRCFVTRRIFAAPSWAAFGGKHCAAAEVAKARRCSGRAELFGRIAEVFDRGAWRFAALELLVVAVDPDHRHVHLQQRRDVVDVAAADVEPAFLAAYPPRASLK